MNASNEVVARMDKVFEKLKEYKVKKQNYLYRIWTCTLVAILVVNVISFVGGGFFYSKRIITFGFVYVIYSYGNMLKILVIFVTGDTQLLNKANVIMAMNGMKMDIISGQKLLC